MGRARLIGALLLIVAFGAGVATGYYLLPRKVPEGVVISVRASGRIPTELEELDLTDAQRTQIRGILHGGTLRVGRIMRDFMVPMNAAIDTTDQEIRAILSATQVQHLDEIRKTRPLKRMQEKKVIEGVR